jgi:hypothetical protein
MNSAVRMTILTPWALVMLSGCSVLGYDHRAQVALGVLNQRGGQIDEAAYTAALNGRFPTGANAGALMDFVRALGGQCKAHEAGPLHCDVPLSGAFCVTSELVIAAALTPTGAIDHLTAGRLNKAC